MYANARCVVILFMEQNRIQAHALHYMLTGTLNTSQSDFKSFVAELNTYSICEL